VEINPPTSPINPRQISHRPGPPSGVPLAVRLVGSRGNPENPAKIRVSKKGVSL